MQIKNNQLKKLSIQHLLEIRSHLGHKVKYIDFFSEGFVLGQIDGITVFHVDRIWKSLKIFYEVLAHSFFRRNTFFMVLTNKNIPSGILADSFQRSLNITNSNKIFTPFYIIGYLHKGWYGGLLANWTRIYLLLRKFLKENKQLSKKRIAFLKQLKGVWTRQLNPTFPDFIITLDSNTKSFHESRLVRLPILGLSDVNTNPFNFSLFVPGNDDSLDNIEFFLKFIEEAIAEGRFKEQELFFHLILINLNKIIEQESF